MVLTALTVGACGGDSGPKQLEDGSSEALDVSTAAYTVSRYCLAEFERGAPARLYGRMLDAVDTLVETKRDGYDVDDELKDAAASLDRCGEPDLARRLDRELR